MPAAVEFRSVRSTEEAVASLSEHGSDACVIAGGTDVMMQYARHELSPAVFVHIEGIKELTNAQRDGSLRLGALVTHRHLADDPVIRTGHPALAEAAATVGGWQTQGVGTLGGNLCNASPAADTAPPLLVADATVELCGPRGIRRVPLEEFFLGRRHVDRRPEELLTGVEAAPLGPRQAEVYLKVGRRGGMVVAVAGLAARLTFDEQGVIAAARLAVCSVGPTPLRVRPAEEALLGLCPSGRMTDDGYTALEEAIAALSGAVSPIDDVRSSAAYRRAVLPRLLRRSVEVCRAAVRAGISQDDLS